MTNHNTNALGACAHLDVTPEEDEFFDEFSKSASSAAATSVAAKGMTFAEHQLNTTRLQGGNSHSPTPYRPPTR